MTKVTSKPNELEQTPTEVIDYLLAHPDFFNTHSHVLAQMNLAHESGAATSLIERQVSILRRQNHKTRAELHDATENARLNEQLSDKIHRLGLQLLITDSLEDSLNSIITSFNSDFSIHNIRIVLWQDQLEADTATLVVNEAVILDNSDSTAYSKYMDKLRRGEVICGQLDKSDIEGFFGESETITSAALLPLKRDNTFGLIGLGGKNSDRFRRDLGTVFLTRLAELISHKLWQQLTPS